MKNLHEYLKINETVRTGYEPAAPIKDWDRVLKAHQPGSFNYSQLGGIESMLDNGEISKEDMEYWIETMFDEGVSKNDREILVDMWNFMVGNYKATNLWWGGHRSKLLAFAKKRSPWEWGTSEEGYATIMQAPLNRSNAKYGELLAEYANGAFADDVKYELEGGDLD